MSVQINLQGRTDKEVARVMTGRLTEGPVATQAAIGAREKHI
jgi:hypothetical protein